MAMKNKMVLIMIIYCCKCKKDVEARLTQGREVYPHRADLSAIPFWICDECRCFVGCHYKTKEKTKPLGVIPCPEIKNARRHIHAILDPIWKSGVVSRNRIYSMLSDNLGYDYHTAEIRDIEEARKVYSLIMRIKKSQSLYP